MEDLIYKTQVIRFHFSTFTFNDKGELCNIILPKPKEIEEKIAQRRFDVVNYLETNPPTKEEISKTNFMNMNILMIAITHNINEILDYIFENKMFTSDELRDMKKFDGV